MPIASWDLRLQIDFHHLSIKLNTSYTVRIQGHSTVVAMEAPTRDIQLPLLEYLREELDASTLQYHSPPTPLVGGYGTHLFTFQLTHAPKALSHRLVLRLFHKSYPKGQAYLEGTAHRVLVDAGYPVPPVYVIGEDPTILGDEFIVMAFMSGKPLLDAC